MVDVISQGFFFLFQNVRLQTAKAGILPTYLQKINIYLLPPTLILVWLSNYGTVQVCVRYGGNSHLSKHSMAYGTAQWKVKKKKENKNRAYTFFF